MTRACLAQRPERRTCNAMVIGSTPIAGYTRIFYFLLRRWGIEAAPSHPIGMVIFSKFLCLRSLHSRRCQWLSLPAIKNFAYFCSGGKDLELITN